MRYLHLLALMVNRLASSRKWGLAYPQENIQIDRAWRSLASPTVE